jgi:hypothetical protein
MGGYFEHIEKFIEDMNKIFEFGDNWGMYIPEVKYLSPEPLVNYTDLSLNEYPNVHFVGDALSARGITVSGAHGIYVAESLVNHVSSFGFPVNNLEILRNPNPCTKISPPHFLHAIGSVLSNSSLTSSCPPIGCPPAPKMLAILYCI